MSDLSHLMDIIRTDREMVPPGEERLELKKGGRAWRRREREKKRELDEHIERIHERKKTQAKYYRKNKAKLNAQRALRNAQPEYVYYKAKDRAKRAGIEWDFTFESWLKVWDDCPRVLDLASGFYVTAWSKKGSNVHTSAQMHRKNIEEGWSPDNAEIVYLGIRVLAAQKKGFKTAVFEVESL